MNTEHLGKLLGDIELAATEYVDAAIDVTDAGHEHGDDSPQFRDAHTHYMNWRSIHRDACNTLRTALGMSEQRGDTITTQETT